MAGDDEACRANIQQMISYCSVYTCIIFLQLYTLFTSLKKCFELHITNLIYHRQRHWEM